MKYRDFRYVIPFLIQFLLFLTPVIYPPGITSNPALRLLMAINPMSAPLDILRASFTSYTPDLSADLISLGSSLILGLIGIVYFRKTEAYFADLA